MQLVSASKLKRAQGRLFQARGVLEFLDGLIARVLGASEAPGWDHPLCARHEARPTALVLFTSDTGLCGSHNTHLIHLAEAHLRRDTARATRVIFIGKKGHRYFTKRGVQPAGAYLDLAGRPDLAKAEAIGRALIQRFLAGEFGAIDVLCSKFVSAMTYRPTLTRWLPIAPAQLGGPATARSASRPRVRRGRNGVLCGDYLFEPSPERVFEELLPRWTLAKFQLLFLEAFTSEHSARMIAMKNATDNAEKLVTEMTMQRNKIRQASITKEISEIVGTAEALK